MKRIATFALLAVGACGQESLEVAQGQPIECVTDFEQGVDYYPHKADLRHAQNFSITYHLHYKVLRARDTRSGFEDLVVLNRCGTPAPDLVGELADAYIVDTPVSAFASTSPASVLRVRLLDQENRIAAMPANPYDSTLAALVESGEVAKLGLRSDPHLETMLVRGVDALVMFVATLEEAGELRRARDAGVPAIPLLAWAEPTYLGQAEWLKHHAALFEREGEAEDFFADVEVRFTELTQLVADHDPVPVIWATPNTPGKWWVEAGNWQDEALDAAGGRNLFTADPPEGFLIASTEELIEIASAAEVWVTNTDAVELSSILPVANLPVFESGRVYHVHGRSDAVRDAFDWYETPLVRPDLVLEDLIEILHPGLIQEARDLKFLAQVSDVAEAPGGRH